MPACTADIYPTIVDILGLKVPGQVQPLDGISLLPLFDGRMKERPTPIGFWHHGGGGPKFDADAGHAAFTDNRYKLHKLGADKYELYDLAADPAEATNLAAQQPETLARLKTGLAAWQQSVLKSFRGEDYPPGDSVTPPAKPRRKE